MAVQIFKNALVLSLLSLCTVNVAEARSRGWVAENAPVQSVTSSDDADEPTAAAKVRRKQRQANRTPESSDEPYWYLRIQQLPILGMAMVSDNGALDLEFMKVVNKNFHVGPTGVFHFGKKGDTKMQSFNLGVRSDLILSEFGNLTDIYLSTALMLGHYSSRTQVYNPVTDALSCDFSSQGYHRVGALAVGKIWTLSDSLHVTTGLGAVKTKTMGNPTKTVKGQCSRSITESDGQSLPWVDFGVGFRL